MNDVERRVRDSFTARAEDVEPTPALWISVRDRHERSRRRRLVAVVAAAAGLAAVLAVSAAVVPDLVGRDGPAPFIESSPTGATRTPDDGQPTPDEPATRTPSESDGARETTSPSAAEDGTSLILTTDGSSVRVVDANGRTRVIVVEGPVAPITALAVRPGSTPDDLTAAYLQETDDGFVLGWISSGPSEMHLRPLPAPYGLRNTATTGSVPAPVWSPDGRHLAWIEDGPDGPMLRTIGWSDGPGTGRTSDDNADLLELPADPAERARLEEWVWVEETSVSAAGYLAYSSLGRPFGVHTFVLERQPDGALAVPSGGPVIESTFPETNHLDLAVTRDGTPVHLLIGDDSEEGLVDLELRVGMAADEGDLPVPEEVRRTSDPTSVWLSGAGDGVVVGSGGRAWFVAADLDPQPLHDGSAVWYADGLR